MRYYFYCHNCKMEELDFKFDRRIDGNKIAWTNSRDGYGRRITHIACPSCGDVLSGFMTIKPGEDSSDVGLIQYLNNVLKMYQHDDVGQGGILKDAANLKAQIKTDMDKRNERIKEGELH